MTHSLLIQKSDFGLPKIQNQTNSLTERSLKLYSLYERAQNGQWIRISDNAYNLKLAYRVFTERLVQNPSNHSIRPISLRSMAAR